MAGLAGIGHFAGGLTRGYLNMSEELRRQEDYDEKRKEREKKRQRESVAAETLGRVGSNVEMDDPNDPTGTARVSRPYTREQGLRDYGTRIAGIDPERSVQAMGQADEFKLRGLQVEGAERANNQARLGDAILQLSQRLAAGDDPVMVFRELQGLNKAIPNGTGSKMFMFNGQPHALLHKDDGDEGQAYPITAETVSKALQRAYAFTSPQAFQQERTYGLQERRTTAAEGQVDVARQNASTMERYRQDSANTAKDRNRIIDDHYRRSDARLGMGPQINEYQRYQLEQQRAFDTQRMAIMADLDAGRISEQDAAKRLRMLAMKFGSPGSREPRTGLQPLQGNPGMFTDGQSLFRMDERTGQLVEVQTPKSLRALGEAISANLPPRGQQQGGLRTSPSQPLRERDTRSPKERYQARQAEARQRLEDARGPLIDQEIRDMVDAGAEEERYRRLGIDPASAAFSR